MFDFFSSIGGTSGSILKRECSHAHNEGHNSFFESFLFDEFFAHVNDIKDDVGESTICITRIF